MQRLELSSEQLRAIRCQEPVGGLTHGFYKYPARFSPQLARAMIEAFTEPGDLVLDPFCGGATTLVEAAAAGREAVGADISQLAVFLARAKTYPLSSRSRSLVRSWAHTSAKINLRTPVARLPQPWRELGYQRHLNCPKTWPIRKSLELLLERAQELRTKRLRDFGRCIILRAGQWALDGRISLPSASAFRSRFLGFAEEMLDGMSEYVTATGNNRRCLENPLCLLLAAQDLHSESRLSEGRSPKLVLTSPPYPGVHVLYHRWQVAGRRETPAPFWIAGALDGYGESHYTFGGRKNDYEDIYFRSVGTAFRSIRSIADQGTVFVQVVGFSNPSRQLPRYLRVLKSVGLEEVIPAQSDCSRRRRVRRTVPNRRWYTNQSRDRASGREVVLFHRPAKGVVST